MNHRFNTIRTEFVDKIRMSHVGGWASNRSRAIKNEMQFFNTTPSAIQNVGTRAPLTNYILRKYFRPMFDSDIYHALSINSYTHLLPDAGLYPNQPIWHCDHARREIEGGLNPIKEDAETIHWCAIIGDNDTPPVLQFIDKHNIDLDDRIIKEKSWTGVSRHIDRKVKSGWSTFAFKPFDLFTFRGNELYRSQTTTGPVNRFVIKVTLFPEGHPSRPTGTGESRKRNLHMVYVGC